MDAEQGVVRSVNGAQIHRHRIEVGESRHGCSGQGIKDRGFEHGITGNTRVERQSSMWRTVDLWAKGSRRPRTFSSTGCSAVGFDANVVDVPTSVGGRTVRGPQPKTDGEGRVACDVIRNVKGLGGERPLVHRGSRVLPNLCPVPLGVLDLHVGVIVVVVLNAQTAHETQFPGARTSVAGQVRRGGPIRRRHTIGVVSVVGVKRV